MSSGGPVSSASVSVVTSGKSSRSASALLHVGEAGAEHVDERAAGAAHRVEHLAQALAAVVLDDDRHDGRDVGLDVAVDARRVGGRHREIGVFELPGERPAFH